MKNILAMSLATVLFAGTLSTAHADDGFSRAERMQKLQSQLTSRFQKADINGDGQLTRDEAQKAMPRVYQHFDEIDAQKKGFVTQEQIEAFLKDKAQARAKSP